MSILSSHHSRPSFDLEDASTYAASIENPRLYRQTRLHHSPSLPDIRCPSRSDPIPQDIISADMQNLHRPPTPPHPLPELTLSPQPAASIPKPLVSGAKKQLAARSLEPAIPPFRPGRRNKKIRVPSYITPPLTPASSITTAASVDSSVDAPEAEDDYFCDSDKSSSRVVVLGFSNNEGTAETLTTSVVEALNNASLNGMNPSISFSSDMVNVVDDRHANGELVLVFHDIRHARLAHHYLANLKTSDLFSFTKCQEGEDSTILSVRYLVPEDAMKRISKSSTVADVDGGFYVTAVPDRTLWDGGKPCVINIRALKNYLRSFGDLQSFTFVRENVENKLPLKTFRVEYYNTKDAATTYQSLDNRSSFGMKLSVYGRPWQSGTPEGDHQRERKPDSTTIYSSRSQRFSAISQFTGTNPSTFNAHDTPCAPQWEGEIRTEHRILCANPERNCDYCPSRRTPLSQPPFHIPPTPSPPIAICSPPIPHMVMSPPPMPPLGIDYSYPHQMYGYPPWAFEKPIQSLPSPLSITPPVIPYPPPMTFWPGEEGRIHMPNFNAHGTIECHFLNGMAMTPVPPFQMPSTPPSTDARNSMSAHRSPSPVSTESLSFGRLTLQNGTQMYPPGEISSKNQLVVGRIQDGVDTRTTVMIKNIPNKMSDKDLITYINKVCPRRIDFLYLRMDFQNGCNVGYAFVNFIEAQDLLKFAKARLGEKWNMFSSEKVLQMSYANYQGKEALVEKFKNSCIMDERESWRPKIFFSSGPNQGLPEPFPAPTHIRRKERSSFNRGALYVPGLHTRNTLNSPLSTGDDAASTGHRGIRKGGRSSGNVA